MSFLKSSTFSGIRLPLLSKREKVGSTFNKSLVFEIPKPGSCFFTHAESFNVLTHSIPIFPENVSLGFVFYVFPCSTKPLLRAGMDTLFIGTFLEGMTETDFISRG